MFGEDLEEFELAPALAAFDRHQDLPWRDEGHPWIGRRLRRSFGGKPYDASVVTWLAEGQDAEAEPAMWHVTYDDGDDEHLKEPELAAALAVFDAGGDAS